MRGNKSRRPSHAVVLIATLALLSPTLVSAAQSGSYVFFGAAKRQLAEYAAMTCTGSCKSRVYACQRRSAQRVDCRAETLVVREGIVEPQHEFVVEREICSWIGVATPSKYTGPGLHLEAEHFRCRLAKPGEGLGASSHTRH